MTLVTSTRRSHLEIKLDMLRAARKPILKTRLMYAVNLSYAPLERYLGQLIARGLIEKREVPPRRGRGRRDGRLRGLYTTTERGLQMLQYLESPIAALMEDIG